jgi:dihydroorotate dehydrogenase electron transfer subunit
MTIKTNMDQPQFLPITKIVDETSQVKTFYFSYELKSKPGQFVMLWIPGLDQKPFSVGYDNGTQFGLTIFNRGPLTKKLFEMNVGDRVGITGPYGTAFSIKPNTHYIMVAGGYGAAPLGFLAEELAAYPPLSKRGQGELPVPAVTIDFCVGARDKDNLLFEKRIEKLSGVTIHVATDDGSKGHKGYVTDLLPDLIKNYNGNKKILLVTCGPELMEKKVLDAANNFNVDAEISIERYMKCGVGICGQCCIDPLGIRMCMEGPVVSKEIANKLTEFGKYHRDKSGAKIFY